MHLQDAIKQESYVGEAIVRTRGDVISSFANCDGVLEGTVCTGAQEHVYMETMGAIGVPKREQNEIEVFVSHQAPSFIQVPMISILHSSPLHCVEKLLQCVKLTKTVF